MATSIASQTLSANEAACVTGVPLKQVHRIIDAGLLGSAATNHKGSRVVLRDGLVGLKLAHETTDTLTLDGRRRLVRYLLDNPEARAARESHVSVDVRLMKGRSPARAFHTGKGAEDDRGRQGRTLRFRVHQGNPYTRSRYRRNARQRRRRGRQSATAYPALTGAQIEAAVLYARAYPRRGRPRGEPFWRNRKPVISSEVAFHELPPTR